MAGSKRFWVLVTGLALLAEAGARSEDGPKSSDRPAQLVVWIRPASDAEMRLDPESAPALRRLARQGVSFPALAPLAREPLIASLRQLGREISPDYREVTARVDSPEDSLARLLSDLGAPPPISQEEEKALERLRHAIGRENGRAGMQAAAKGESGRDDEPASKVAAPEAPGGGAASQDAAEPALIEESVLDALSGGARLTLILDGEQPSPESPGDRREEALDRIATSLLAGLARRRKLSASSALLVVLFPEDGPPALIAAGHLLKRGRMLGAALDAREIVAGVRRWLGESGRGTPAEKAAWVDEILLPLAEAGNKEVKR
ncbi:MAG: hypothetical protein JXA90_02250 [Planctomycetes bacterium]|nr:hypothetical protein [Planctomycetota bacterium]